MLKSRQRHTIMTQVARLLAMVLFLSPILSGCMSRSVMNAIIENAEFVPTSSPDSHTVEIPDPSILKSLPTVRRLSRSKTSAKRHIGWEIFEIDDLFYGRNIKDPAFEFISHSMETQPSAIVLTGHAAATSKIAGTYQSTESGKITINESNKILIEGGVEISR